MFLFFVECLRINKERVCVRVFFFPLLSLFYLFRQNRFFFFRLSAPPSIIILRYAGTIVVADTGEIEKIKIDHPQDSTTNPSLINAASRLAEYR